MFDRKFYREIRNWIAALARFRRFALLLSTIVFPAGIGVAGAIGAYNSDAKSTTAIIQGTLLVVGMLMGAGLFWYDESPVSVFQKFAHEVQRCTDLERQISNFNQEVVKLSAHINCLGIAARAVEGAFLSTSDPEGLRETVKSLLTSVSNQRAQLFGITDDEQWNFGVYRNLSTELVCVFQTRNFGQPGDTPRVWPVGTGHIGLTFQQNSELLTSDVAAHSVFQAKGDLRHEHDSERYRGVFSICIPDVNNDHAVGVLIATSSKVGRFDQSNVQPLRDLAQSIGAILSPRI